MRVAVIGGGAAGQLAAIKAAENGHRVTIFEQNEKLGKKLFITGKGRCNVTNAADREGFFRHVVRNPRFLYSAYAHFDSAAIMQLIETAGVPLKIERGQRVFPVSDHSSDILKALEKTVRSRGVDVRLNTRVSEILTNGGRISGVRVGETVEPFEAVILATGGISYPSTGSTGDGYRFAQALGHTIVPPKGSLVPFETEETWCESLSGLTLKNVTLTVYNIKGKEVYSELGEMLFTHFGVSGPLVLSASAHMRHMDSRKYRLEIDLKPGLDEKKLDARLLRDFEKYANREFKNALVDLAGQSMIPVLIDLSGIPEDTKVHDITREQRMRLLRLFKAFPVSVSGKRPIDEAIVTAGGVNPKEVNPRTMESKLMPGLYFAGEVLDLDAYTGGFNLQIAWSTAHTAGQAVLKEEYQ